jgi:hypothetical protein
MKMSPMKNKFFDLEKRRWVKVPEIKIIVKSTPIKSVSKKLRAKWFYEPITDKDKIF